jgi:hypothetical protein
MQTPAALRERLHALLPDYGDVTLQAFVLRVFSDDGVLQAYFRPTAVTEMPTIHKPVLPVRLRKCLPIEAALRAADHASALALVRPHERRLVHLAALLYPCAWFDSNRMAALSRQTGLAPSLEQTAALRAMLLEDAMRWLRAHCHGLADTLAAAIGLPNDGDINDEQVARIASAVYLANLRLCAEWAA